MFVATPLYHKSRGDFYIQ